MADTHIQLARELLASAAKALPEVPIYGTDREWALNVGVRDLRLAVHHILVAIEQGEVEAHGPAPWGPTTSETHTRDR